MSIEETIVIDEEIYYYNVVDIYLDPENPRHEHINTQPEIIEYLISKESVRNLAKDIAENDLSPLDNLALLKTDDGLFVIEGNRRVCACKLLLDPELAPSKWVDYFKKLSESAQYKPTQVPCALYNSRESADLWITRRHEGEQEGIGTKQWRAEQKSRYSVRTNQKDKNALALSLIEYAINNELVPQNNEIRKSLTTITRYFTNPTFRDAFGIISGVREPIVRINAEFEEFNRALNFFLGDLLDINTDIGSRSKVEDRLQYLNDLIDKGITPSKRVRPRLLNDNQNKDSKFEHHPPLDHEDTPAQNEPDSKEISPTDNNRENDEAGNSGEKSSNTTPHIQDRKEGGRGYRQDTSTKKNLFSDFTAPVNNELSRKAYYELKKHIPIQDAPLSATITLRAFLEATYLNYQKNVLPEKYKEKQNTHQRLLDIIQHLDKIKSELSNEEKNALGALKRVQSDQNNTLSPKTLGSFAHIGHYPTARHVIDSWDNISAIIKYLLSNTP